MGAAPKILNRFFGSVVDMRRGAGKPKKELASRDASFAQGKSEHWGRGAWWVDNYWSCEPTPAQRQSLTQGLLSTRVRTLEEELLWEGRIPVTTAPPARSPL